MKGEETMKRKKISFIAIFLVIMLFGMIFSSNIMAAPGDKVDITVVKSWAGEPTDSVTVNLLQNGSDCGESAILSEGNSWTHTFSMDEGHWVWSWDIWWFQWQSYTYTVEEVNITGYTTHISDPGGSGDKTINILNISQEGVEIGVEKIWIGPGQDSATINLLRDGVEIDQVVLGNVVTLVDGWSHLFYDIAKYDQVTGAEYVYTITEDPIPGYSTEILPVKGGYQIINRNTEEVQIEVEKVWIGPGIDQATVNLLADGSEVDEIVLNEDNEWDHVFKDLFKYDQTYGHEIAYTVTEDAIEGYDTTVMGDSEAGFVVRNYNNETIDIPVKIDLQCGGASSINVTLSANGTTLFVSLVDASTDWKKVFEDMPKYDPVTGEVIPYVVSFEGASGDCDFEITGDLETGFNIVIRGRDTAIISDGGLPKTGDVSYLIGASVMIAGAGVLVVTRKR